MNQTPNSKKQKRNQNNSKQTERAAKLNKKTGSRKTIQKTEVRTEPAESSRRAENNKKRKTTPGRAGSTYLLIVDGSSLLATSYYSSLPKLIRKEKDEVKKQALCEKILKKDAQGRYTNALELFFHTLFTIMTFQRPTHLVVCWDVTRNTFRKELWESYKSNRSETPAALREQFETAYEVCEKLGIPQYRDSHYEADDFAGTLCTVMEPYMDVRILTRDKDYFQLISERTSIWYGMSDLDKVRTWRKKHQMAPCLPSRVVEVDRRVLKKEFGYLPESVPMIKALAGDTSDNIPGVSGIGEIRSMMLAEHYLCPEELYRDIEKANTAQKKKRLNRMWQQWGINKSPYSCLTRRSTPKRKSAREMADLCFILGRIRTDIDLTEYSGCDFIPDLLLFRVTHQKLNRVLAEYDLKLIIGRKKKPAFIEADNQPKKRTEPAKNSSVLKDQKKFRSVSTNPGRKQGTEPVSEKNPEMGSEAKSVQSNRNPKAIRNRRTNQKTRVKTDRVTEKSGSELNERNNTASKSGVRKKSTGGKNPERAVKMNRKMQMPAFAESAAQV